MRDFIEEVVSIQGELVEFIAIVYRENGIEPKALMRARFPSGNCLLGYQTTLNMDKLKEAVRQVSRGIATYYGYDMAITTLSDLINSHSYARLLKQMQRQHELPINGRDVTVCLN